MLKNYQLHKEVILWLNKRIAHMSVRFAAAKLHRRRMPACVCPVWKNRSMHCRNCAIPSLRCAHTFHAVWLYHSRHLTAYLLNTIVDPHTLQQSKQSKHKVDGITAYLIGICFDSAADTTKTWLGYIPARFSYFRLIYFYRLYCYCHSYAHHARLDFYPYFCPFPLLTSHPARDFHFPALLFAGPFCFFPPPDLI